jgi:glycosyltransferase involved in cell wall biosynthesis
MNVTVALLTDGIFPYVIGGMQKHSFYLCKFLAQRGIYVDLYHTPSQTQHDIQQLDCFTEEEKPYIHSIVIPFPQGDKFPGHYIRASKRYSQAIYEVFNTRKMPDIVYIQGFSGWTLLTEKQNTPNLPPTIVNFHGLEMFQPPTSWKGQLQNWMFRPFVKKNIQAADYAQSLGGKLTPILQQFIPQEKIWELGIGVDKDWIREAPLASHMPRRFCFVGRYERRKGIIELTQVLRSLHQAGHAFHFDFIGFIPKEQQIVADNIHYHGQVIDPKKIQSLLQSSDVLVCPSYSEGMPTVILEAMASGCSIIATDVGAVADVVCPENGWLIPSGNIPALESTMKTVLEIPDEVLQKKKAAAIAFIAQKHLWSNIIEAKIRFFQQIRNA